jgi:pimeloyl-ACP methyl ester carboxylesterase
MANHVESALFFPAREPGAWLYGCLHAPSEKAGKPGLVFVPAVGRERHRAYRELRWLARELADRGWPVLRFDYRGEGESAGTFAESTLTSRVHDVGAAIDELVAKTGVTDVCLVGFQLGAAIALAAAATEGASRLVLCDPITNVKAYARNLVRSNVVLQNTYFGKAEQGEEALRKTLADGGTISVYGYPMAQALLAELESFDPAPHLAAFKGKSLLAGFSPREAPPKKDVLAWQEALGGAARSTAQTAVLEQFSWTSRTFWTHRMPSLREILPAWLAEPNVEGAPALAARPTRFGTATPPDRTVVTLDGDRGERMVGIFTKPAPSVKDRRETVIVLQAGLLNKTGVGDYFRWLGDALAADGFSVLRMDQRGTGDSDGEIISEVPIDAYFREIQTGAAKADTLEQIEWVRRTVGHDSIHLLGQCGGSVTAILAAGANPEPVRTLVCIAMAVLYSEAIDKVREGDAAIAGQSYLAKLKDPASWKRLVSGASDYKLVAASARAMAKKVGQKAYAKVDDTLQITKLVDKIRPRVAPDHARFNKEVWDAFPKVMKAGRPILFLNAQLDNETPEFEDEFRKKVLDKKPEWARLCPVQLLENADHSLMFAASREDSLKRIRAWLDGERS